MTHPILNILVKQVATVPLSSVADLLLIYFATHGLNLIMPSMSFCHK